MGNGYDGMVTIGFKGDTKQLEKDIRDTERQLKQYEKEAEKLTKQQQKIEIDLEDYYKAKQTIEETTNSMLKQAQTQEEVDNVLKSEEKSLNQLNEAYSTQLKAQEEINQKVQENVKNQEIAKSKIKSLNGELAKAKGYEKIKGSINDIGNGIEKVIKKVGRWALAVFGIRSAYMFVRQSMSTLSQYDDQMAADLEYIRWALATTIKPIIEWIIKAVYTLLGVIGSVIKSIFNVNIFANASADAFQRAKKSVAGTNKEAKQLQKTLAGFDEMNVLQADGSTGTAGGVGASIPSMDLGNIFDSQEIQNVKNFWADIVKFWEKDWDDFIDTLDGKWAKFFGGIVTWVKGLWDVIKGVGEVIIGLVEMIFGFITGDFDLLGKGFNMLIQGIKDIFIGIIEMAIGRIQAIFGLITGILWSIWDVFYHYIVKPVGDFFGGLFNTVKNAIGKVFDKVSDAFGRLVGIVKAPFQGMIDLVSGLWEKIKKPIDTLVKNINKALDKVNPINLLGDIGKGIGKGIGSIGKFFGFAKGGIVVPKLATGGIINQPGRGVPISSAIGGERGIEGVIPLTDSQQMELLGSAIGRYITVNLTNVTKLDSRQIARKVDKVQQSNDFVFNR